MIDALPTARQGLTGMPPILPDPLALAGEAIPPPGAADPTTRVLPPLCCSLLWG